MIALAIIEQTLLGLWWAAVAALLWGAAYNFTSALLVARGQSHARTNALAWAQKMIGGDFAIACILYGVFLVAGARGDGWAWMALCFWFGFFLRAVQHEEELYTQGTSFSG